VNAGLSVRVEADGTSLQVNEGSAMARRDLGAFAWAVLETLALAGTFDEDGPWMTRSNARDLGRRLGVGKDRAAAALLTLRQAGLVVAHIGRAAGSARFAPSRYEVRVPVSCIPDTAPHAARTETRSCRSHSTNETATLFNDL
jgi:hypothetical protein